MTEQSIFDNKNITANSEQIAILKKHFPNCFDKEGNFLINSFKEIIKSNDVDTSHEGYTLNWLGKSYARLLANEKPRTLIRPDKEHNAKVQNKNSNNLLIKGDNLEVLKHLKNAYTEAVKVIYIDPPYNTGSDGFVYKDDRRFTKEELTNLANVSEEEAQRILDFTDRGSNSHSAWLTFIYPRLYIARELLREDGVIFISIDDNEQAQLKLLCDEIFGEENFITDLIWKKKQGGGNDSKNVVIEHEYIVGYSKDISKVDLLLDTKYELSDSLYPFKDEKGEYGLITLDKSSIRFSDSLVFEIKDKDGHSYFPRIVKGKQTCWRWGRNKVEEDYDLLVFKNDKVYTKYYRPEGVIPRSLLVDSRFGRTESGQDDIKAIFDFAPFSYPKPISLISYLLQISINSSDIILDFFAGSGTTAHAMMELNAEDEGNRQYIMVQLPEETDKKSEAYKANFKTIFDITKARIEKAAEKIQAEKPDYKGDLGFKIFETTILPEYYDEEIDKLSVDTQTQLWDGSEADESLLEAILTTWTLYDRILLTTDLDTIMFGDYKTYYGKGTESNTLYLMHKGFNIDHIKLIIDKLENDKEFTPKKIVIYGHNFDTKSQRELSEALNSFRNKKSLEIDIIKRY